VRRNIGRLDRAFRVALGVALLGAYFILSPPINRVGLIGFLPIGIALIGWCPAASMMLMRR
jgi:hypothetical protein